jgi:hypothetical protein
MEIRYHTQGDNQRQNYCATTHTAFASINAKSEANKRKRARTHLHSHNACGDRKRVAIGVSVNDVLYQRNVAFVGLELVERHVECSVVVHVKIVTNQRTMRLKTVKANTKHRWKALRLTACAA